MLSDFIEAIISHLSGADAAVYQADCVPSGAACPYITMNTAAPLGDSAGALTLTVWHHSNAGRIALAEQISSLMPAQGMRLFLPSGHAVMTGSTAVFLQEASLYGIRMVWKLRFFPAG